MTFRLVDSPACVVVDDNELSPHLLRMLKAAGQEAPASRPILEINPQHALVARVQDVGDAVFSDWAQVILDQALLAEGASLEDPTAFVGRVNKLLLAGIAPQAAA